MPTWILGVSALYHDAAVVLLRDGVVVAAAQEERFTRVKHDASLPRRAAAWALAEAGLTAADLDWLVFYEKPLRKFERILANTVTSFPKSILSFPRQMHAWFGDKLWLRSHLVDTFGVPSSKLLFCEHHLSHAASAFYPSPHAEAAVLVADGVGEWATTSLWRGSGATLEPVAELRFPHSLGLLYSAITAYLGFAVNEGEYKVMGMAAHGTPRYRDVFDRLATIGADGSVTVDLDHFAWHWHPTRAYTPRLVEKLGAPRAPGTPFPAGRLDADAQRHADIAASAQLWLEDAMAALVRHAAERVGTDALCLAGGVALNAVNTGKLGRGGPYRHLWVQPAAGDAGGAMGAALWAWHSVLGNPRGAPMEQAAWGPSADRGRTRQLLDDLGFRFTELEPDAFVHRAAGELAEGKVLGWVEGRSEWGPRALGHRSILADPTVADVAERVNVRVKFREPFRPFAPAVPREAATAFDIAPALAAPTRWMLATVPVPAETAARVPAVVHADGSARVQVVHAEESPAFHALLTTFGQARGTPILLNTSFNLKGDPMVQTPVDALAGFVRSGLDVLYLDGFRVERPEGGRLEGERRMERGG